MNEQPPPSSGQASATEIRQWQRSLIDQVLRILFLAAIPTFAMALYHVWQDRTMGVAPFYLLSVLLLAVLRFWKGAPYFLKVGGLLLLAYGLALVSFLRVGLGSEGRVFLLMVSFVAVTFLNRRVALICLGVSLAVMMILGWIFSAGVLTIPPEVQLLSSKPSAWFNYALSFLMLSAFLIASQHYLLPRFAETLWESRKMARALERERLEAERVAAREQRYTDRLRWVVSLGSEVFSIKKREAIVTRLAQEIARVLDVYQVNFFLVDYRGDALVLRATAGKLGAAWAEEAWRIPVGARSLPGRVAQTAKEQVMLLSPGESSRFPLSRVEVCLPLVIQGELLGVLDVHRAEEVFSEDDLQLLRVLVGYATAALDVLRQLEDSEAQMQEIRELYAQYTLSSWRTLLEEGQAQTYARGMMPEPALRALVEEAAQAQAPRSTVMPGDKGYLLVVPLVARDVNLGYVAFTRTVERGDWDSETLQLLEAAAERLAMALDNTRLLVEARRQVHYDEELGRISDMVWGTPNVETIMDRSVRELGRFLEASEVTLYVSPSGAEREL